MMVASSLKDTYPTGNTGLIEPNYFTLRRLAVYASCSVRWLRDRLVDRVHPLPHYRVGGKLLVKRDEFDRWMEAQRVAHPSGQLTEIVESVVAQICSPRRVA
jgi:excisionase family DNA binding protein